MKIHNGENLNEKMEKTLVEEKNSEITPKKSYKKIISLILFLIAVFTLFFILKKSHVLVNLLKKTKKELNSLYLKNKTLSLFIMFLINLLNCILALPIHVFFLVIVSIIISDFKSTFCLLTLFNILNCLIIYSAKNFIKSVFKNVFFNQKQKKILKKSISKNSFKISCLIRVLYLNPGMKDYILIFLDFSFFDYFLSSIIFNIPYALLDSSLGLEFNNIEDYVNNPGNWNDESLTKQICVVLSVFGIIFSFLILISIGIWVRKKLNVKVEEKLKEKIEENNDKGKTEFEINNIGKAKFEI